MTYRDRLHPWCIIRNFTNCRVLIVARFRCRNEAEEHLKILRRLTPKVPYEIIFDR
jgi:hypothetical protein